MRLVIVLMFTFRTVHHHDVTQVRKPSGIWRVKTSGTSIRRRCLFGATEPPRSWVRTLSGSFLFHWPVKIPIFIGKFNFSPTTTTAHFICFYVQIHHFFLLTTLHCQKGNIINKQIVTLQEKVNVTENYDTLNRQIIV